MRDVYIVEAVRSPIGRRRGDLATLHPGDLLGAVQKGALDRRGIDPARIDQVIGGCVSQVGEQSFNIARCGLALAGPAPRGPPDHHRQSVRVQSAGDHARHGSDRLGDGGGGPDLWSRDDDPRPARREHAGGQSPPEVLFRAVRLQLAVRRRTDDRRGVRDHPRGYRQVRPEKPGAGHRGLGCRPLRCRGRPHRGSDRGQGGQPDRRDADREARRRPAPDLAREAGSARAGEGPDTAHGRQLVTGLGWRRGPDSGLRGGRTGGSGSSRALESSPRPSSASIPSPCSRARSRRPRRC